jgi:hypothetical protein
MAQTLFKSNDTLLFRKDRFYDPFNGFYPVIGFPELRQNLTIGTYGPDGEPSPVFDSLTYEASNATGWALEGAGTGVWSKFYTTSNVVGRLFVGGYNNGNRVNLRNPGTAMRRAKTATGSLASGPTNGNTTVAAIIANLNAQDIWWSGNASVGWKLFIYTGSDTIAPPAFYNGLAMQMTDQATLGSSAAFTIRNAQDVLIENIDSWGSSTIGFNITGSSTDASPTKNVTIRNCNAKYFYAGAVRVQTAPEDNASLAHGIIDGVLIENVIGDTMTHPLEQEPSEEYGNLGGRVDMFTGYDWVKNVRYRKCKSINSFHVAFAAGAYNFNSAVSDNVVFEDCEAYSDSWNTYTRGITTYTVKDNCQFIRCKFDGMNVRSQFAGSPILTACDWRNFRTSTRKSGVSQWIEFGAEIVSRTWVNVGNEKYVYAAAVRVIIQGGYVENPPTTPVIAETFSAYGLPVAEPTLPDGFLTIANMVIIDKRGGATSFYGTFNRSSVVGTAKLTNNAVYTGPGNPVSTVSLNGTITAINAAPGCSGNLTVDPLINTSDPSNMYLERNSPLRRAGTTIGACNDAKGRPYQFPPTIGPLEYSSGTFRS